MLTISRLSRWSINYYNETAREAKQAAMTANEPTGDWGSTTQSARPGCRHGCLPETPRVPWSWSGWTGMPPTAGRTPRW